MYTVKSTVQSTAIQSSSAGHYCSELKCSLLQYSTVQYSAVGDLCSASGELMAAGLRPLSPTATHTALYYTVMYCIAL